MVSAIAQCMKNCITSVLDDEGVAVLADSGKAALRLAEDVTGSCSSCDGSRQCSLHPSHRRLNEGSGGVNLKRSPVAEACLSLDHRRPIADVIAKPINLSTC